MKRIFFQVIFFLLALSLDAASLKVSPGGFMVQNISPGKTYNLQETTKIKLSIFNDDTSTHTYALTVHKPSAVGNWEKGYLEIPDPAWCWFSPNDVTICPQKVGYGNLFFKIPDRESYYNQRWVATIGILGKQEQGIGFGLGIYVRVQIETEPKAKTTEPPDGLIGLRPSLVSFDNIPPGGTHTQNLTIFNNDSEKRSFNITSLSKYPDIKSSTYLTSSYSQIPDPAWISLDRNKLTIDPQDSKVLTIKISIPKDGNLSDKKWEEILFVEPENGRSLFIRVRITTAKGISEQP